MSDIDPPEKPEKPKKSLGGLRYNGEITLSTLVILATALIGLVAWAVTANNHAEQAARGQADIQASVTEKMNGLRETIQQGLTEIRQQNIEMRQQIATLPDQRAQMVQTLRRIDDIELHNNSDAARLNALERQQIEMRSDLNQLLRPLNGPLPGRR